MKESPSGDRSADPLVGRRLGDFVVSHPLGQGGFGMVYVADQPLLGRQAVVKVLHGRHLRDEVIIQRFLREARVASHLEHPYAAHIYAFGAEDDGLLWIAMELVRGTALNRMLRDVGALDLEQAVPLIERLCEVVNAAHEQGIVHRDIKPANVMVQSRGGRLMPKLLDFGIAKAAEGLIGQGSMPSIRPIKSDDLRLEPIPSLAETITQEATGTDVTEAASHGAPITRAGETFGSPAYMAPEQWTNAAAVDARADVYALGILAFQTITGSLPFVGRTTYLFAKAHRDDPVPPVGDALPSALDAVFRKALAKSADDRYATATAFGASLREAAGIEPETSLPRLDAQTQDRMTERAPQPIAEMVASIGAARNANQLRDAVSDTVSVAVRYVGVLALAARSKQHIGEDSAAVVQALRNLRSRGLTEEGWLVLAHELCRPYAGAAESHPIPELVRLFFDEDGGERSVLFELLEQLPTGSSTGDRVLRGPAHDLIASLGATIPTLQRLLDELDFIVDYPVARADATGQEAELWIGVRRTLRGATSLRKPSQPNAALLLDARRRPVLLLSPLIEFAPPSPGAPEELFLLAGVGRRGAQLLSVPRGFERVNEAPWSWLREHFLAGDDHSAARNDEAGSPYPGLNPMVESDADNYFGREREAEAFANRLRVKMLLAVAGPSGAGKSSFLRAGVVPRLPEHWRIAVTRPGALPVSALLASLRTAGVEVAAASDAAPEPVARAVADAVRTGDAPLVLIVDQFEELFTHVGDDAERQRFAEVLAGAVAAAETSLRVVIAVRDDFLLRVQGLAALRDHLVHGLQLLGPPTTDDLHRIVREPALRAGYELEEDSLVDEMVEAVDGVAGALPLLAFAARRLWDARDRHFQQLTRKAYDAMGGVAGALAQHAEATLGAMSKEAQRGVREAFRHLVTHEGTRAVLTRDELRQVLGSADVVIDTLVDARLLVASEGETGDDRIEIVHEALLDAWPRLVRWRREDAEGTRLRDELRTAARQWDSRARPRGMLWRDEALLEYRAWRARHSAALTDAERDFAQASLDLAERGRRIKRAVVTAALVGMTAVAVGMFVLYREARDQRQRADVAAEQAQARLIDSYVERGRRALLDGDPRRSVEDLTTAREMGGPSPDVDFMLARASAPFQAELARLDARSEQILDGSFSPDGTRLVLCGASGAVELWDLERRDRIADLRLHEVPVWRALFTPDGQGIVTVAMDGVVGIWTKDGELQSALRGHEAGIQAAAVSGDSRLLATGDDAGTIILWSLEEQRELARAAAHPEYVIGLSFAPGDRLLSSGGGGFVGVWSVPEMRDLGRLGSRADGKALPFAEVDVSPDGQRVLVTAVEGPAELWDLEDRRRIAILDGERGNRNEARFSADGAHVVTTGMGGIVHVWLASTGDLATSLRGHAGFVNTVAFAADGQTISSGGIDGTVRVWHAATGVQLALLGGHERPVMRVEFSPDGGTLLSLGWDGTARLWRVRPAEVAVVGSVGGAPFNEMDVDLRVVEDSAIIATPTQITRVALPSPGPPGSPDVIWTGEEDRIRCYQYRCAVGVGASWVWWATEGALHGEKLTGGNGSRVWIDLPRPVMGLGVDPRGDVTLLFDDGSLGIVEDGNLDRISPSAPGAVDRVSFSEHGERVVATRRSPGGDGFVSVWDSGKRREELVETELELVAAGNDRWLGAAETGFGGWDWNGAPLFFREEKARFLSAAIHPSRPLGIATSGDAELQWIDLRNGAVRQGKGHRGTILGVAFSTDGERLLSVATDGIGVWGVQSGRMLWQHSGVGIIVAGRFSTGGDRIVGVRYDGAVVVVEVPTLDN